MSILGILLHNFFILQRFHAKNTQKKV